MGKENMKRVREGRQHGVVRANKTLPSHWIINPTPNPNNSPSKFMNDRLGSSPPPTAGLFLKPPSNHPKSGRPRCSGSPCHKAAPAAAADKIKGNNRRRSNYVVSHYKRGVADGGPGSLNRLSGSSAARILDHLACQDYMDGDDGYDYDQDCDYGYGYDHDYDYDSSFKISLPEWPWYPNPSEERSSAALEIRKIASVFDDDGKGFGDSDVHEDEYENDDGMSFCDVGFVVEQLQGDDEDDDWCLVEEM